MNKHAAAIMFFLMFTAAVTTSPAQNAHGKNMTGEITEASVNVRWTTTETELFVTLSAPTEGWIAFGIGPERMMKGADIIIGYVKDSQVKIEDHYGTKMTRHISDIKAGGTDNVTVIGGDEKDGRTTIEFSIPLDSGDSYDKKLIPGKEYKIIVAYGTKDSFSSYHKKRGSARITL